MNECDRETELARDEVDDAEAEGDDQAVRCFVPVPVVLPLEIAGCTDAVATAGFSWAIEAAEKGKSLSVSLENVIR